MGSTVTLTSDPVSEALKVLRGAFAGTSLLFRVIGAPAPASRGTQTKFGGHFYSKGHAVYYASCQKQLAEQQKQKVSGPVIAIVETIVEKPKTSKLSMPRGDVDNFANVPLDAATKTNLWGDDYQVVALVSTKRWAKPGEPAGTVLNVIPLGG